MTKPASVTPRRTMQQIIHCVEEALSAYEAREDMLHVQADLEQAEELIQIALKWARERK